MKIYYSIQDGGDGSAYPIFLDTKELAIWDQEQMTDAWAEDCWGELVLESDGNIMCEESLSVDAYYIQHLYDWDESYADEFNISLFAEKFYPNGIPKITVKKGKEKYDFYMNGVLCFQTHVRVKGKRDPVLTEETRNDIEIEINRKAQL